MIILGIETSCDETAAAIVENGTKILSSVVASSVDMHAKTGGIIPEVAAREQLKCIIPVIEETIEQAASGQGLGASSSSLSPNRSPLAPRIDAIAVTYGPGLIGSLLVGVETARTLSYAWNIPLIPTNHLVAHIYANWLSPPSLSLLDPSPISHPQPQFPALALVVSGGHTDLVLMKSHEQIEWIGGTRDDAAGECFDKCARLLGLGYPGGPAISATASQSTIAHQRCDISERSSAINNQQSTIKLPRPMINEPNFDFSFSGLKTAVLREVKKAESNQQSTLRPELRARAISNQQLAHETQEAIVDVLVTKTMKAATEFKVKSILLAGGVAANSRLREKFNHQPSIINHQFQLHIPIPKLCTDNAAIVASAAYFNNHPVPWQEVTTQPGLSVTGEI